MLDFTLIQKKLIDRFSNLDLSEGKKILVDKHINKENSKFSNQWKSYNDLFKENHKSDICKVIEKWLSENSIQKNNIDYSIIGEHVYRDLEFFDDNTDELNCVFNKINNTQLHGSHIILKNIFKKPLFTHNELEKRSTFLKNTTEIYKNNKEFIEETRTIWKKYENNIV